MTWYLVRILKPWGFATPAVGADPDSARGPGVRVAFYVNGASAKVGYLFRLNLPLACVRVPSTRHWQGTVPLVTLHSWAALHEINRYVPHVALRTSAGGEAVSGRCAGSSSPAAP
jgi:hypothetical protein